MIFFSCYSLSELLVTLLIITNMSFRIYPGSPLIRELLRNPVTFLVNNCVSSKVLYTRPLPTTSFAKIVSRGYIFEFKYGSLDGKPALSLGQGDGSQQTPIHGGSFVAPEMSSMNYRIFYDPLRNSSIYYDNVVMAVDFLGIVGSERGTAMTSVYAVYLRLVDLLVQL